MNEVEMEHRITAVEKLAKGNERRIGDLESDNKALLDLSTSVAVMAEQMKTMSSIITLINTDFGTLLRWSLFTRNDNPNGTTMNSRMYFRTSRGLTESPRRVLVIRGVSPMAQI